MKKFYKKGLMALIGLLSLGFTQASLGSGKVDMGFRKHSPSWPIPKYYVLDLQNCSSSEVSGDLSLYDPSGKLKHFVFITLKKGEEKRFCWLDGFSFKKGDKLKFKIKKPRLMPDIECTVKLNGEKL
ncbi:hypothetical protein P4B35_23160 [Pontiellaceae bacterium B12227]|nr:hypothetical protein [Pontiellaceae bacterium B12227]